VRQELKLEPFAFEESVTVSAEYILDAQAKALNQQKTAPNITNVVAADQIGSFPDPNAAETTQRIPGVSIQRDQGEGRYVIVRGTEPRLNSMMIDGERIPSPDPLIRWRVVGTGQVERSTNGGARWEAAKLPESATLIAGSSPSPSICWLVGRTGSIYVTTDGLRFVRVPFPDRTDFVSIQATDGRRATVVTIDGRTMRTDDQGATWIRLNP